MKKHIKAWLHVAWVFLIVTPIASAQDADLDPRDIVDLNPFEVSARQDVGYRATNTITATRIGAAIYDVPVMISVITEDFRNDLNLNTKDEIVRYTAGAQGSEQFFPGTNETIIRGFPAFTIQDGVTIAFGLPMDNAERVEIIKGPTGTFFGQTRPGGIVNIVSKRPQFMDATRVRLSYGSYDDKRGYIDTQGTSEVAGGTLAHRLVFSRVDRKEFSDFAFEDKVVVAPSLSWSPGHRFRITTSYQWYNSHQRANRGSTLNPQRLEDFQNPPDAVVDYFMAEEGIANRDDAIEFVQDRWRLDIGPVWQEDILAATGELPFRGTSGVIPDHLVPGNARNYNPSGPGSTAKYNQHLFNTFIDLVPFDGVTLRYRFFLQDMNTDEHFPATSWHGQGTHTLRALWLVRNQKTNVHFVDGLYEHETNFLRSRFLVGYQRTASRFRQASEGIDNSRIPEQTLEDGTVVDANTLFAEFDPLRYEQFDFRTARVGHQPKSVGTPNWTNAYFAQYSGHMFEDRLRVMAGIRYEQPHRRRTGTSHSLGFNYEFIPGFSFFAGTSEAWQSNGPNVFLAGGNAQILPSDNFVDNMPDEQGSSVDVGIKANWMDGQLSGTLTFYNVQRSNIRNQNTQRTQDDPRNNDGDPTTNVILYDISGAEETEGMELEFMWTTRDQRYQAVFSGSYMWKSGVNENPAFTGRDLEILLDRRLGRTPKFIANFWNKYTFGEGALENLSLGAGFRYQTSSIVAHANPLFQTDVDSQFVVDALIGYKVDWVRNVDTSINLSIQNALNTDWESNGGAPMMPFSALLSVTFSY
ncbi:MAG: TonB-dependent receptor [Opitutales bacterium]|nr:TonB-dependent receptor [Opitutales bacterium]